ncbi:unnamed protein product, partial [Prorocentrum cordatum]
PRPRRPAARRTGCAPPAPRPRRARRRRPARRPQSRRQQQAASSQQAEPEAEPCGLCLEPLSRPAGTVTALPSCGHSFHLQCLLATHAQACDEVLACPLCRAPSAWGDLRLEEPAADAAAPTPSCWEELSPPSAAAGAAPRPGRPARAVAVARRRWRALDPLVGHPKYPGILALGSLEVSWSRLTLVPPCRCPSALPPSPVYSLPLFVRARAPRTAAAGSQSPEVPRYRAQRAAPRRQGVVARARSHIGPRDKVQGSQDARFAIIGKDDQATQEEVDAKPLCTRKMRAPRVVVADSDDHELVTTDRVGDIPRHDAALDEPVELQLRNTFGCLLGKLQGVRVVSTGGDPAAGAACQHRASTVSPGRRGRRGAATAASTNGAQSSAVGPAGGAAARVGGALRVRRVDTRRMRPLPAHGAGRLPALGAAARHPGVRAARCGQRLHRPVDGRLARPGLRGRLAGLLLARRQRLAADLGRHAAGAPRGDGGRPGGCPHRPLLPLPGGARRVAARGVPEPALRGRGAAAAVLAAPPAGARGPLGRRAGRRPVGPGVARGAALGRGGSPSRGPRLAAVARRLAGPPRTRAPPGGPEPRSRAGEGCRAAGRARTAPWK